MKNKKPLLIFLATGVLGFILGITFFTKQGYVRVRNCAELATAYLEMGKKYYGLSSYNRVGWQKAIDKETFIQNYCLEQFSRQYPWDF